MEFALVNWAQSSSRAGEIDVQSCPRFNLKYTWALERLSTWNYLRHPYRMSMFLPRQDPSRVACYPIEW